MNKDDEIILYIVTFLLLITYVFASSKVNADNEITITQSGTDFEVWAEQVGYDHSTTITADGDNTFIMLSQEDAGQTAIIDIDGDNNFTLIQQKEGDHQLELDILNDDNTAAVTQENTGSHSATITLDGMYGTFINLIQDSTTNQSYNLSQNCLNPAGCSISVIQE